MAKSQGVQIGRVAHETGLSIDTIRYYEKEGLLREPPRSEGGFRLYGSHDIEHLRFVRSAQELGFSLAEIRELLLIQDERVESCTHVRDLINQKLVLVRRKLEDLMRLESVLQGALDQCNDALSHDRADPQHENCPVLGQLTHHSSKENNDRD